MRVTDSMTFQLSRAGLASAQRRLYDAQRVAQTGMRVNEPSSDPAAAARASRKRADVERLEAMSDTANSAAFGLALVDGALDHMGELLDRARELAVQAANGTLTAADRAGVATELAQLRDELLAIANTRVDGRYVFAGMRDDVAPFDAAGAFVGDRNVPMVEVAPGVMVRSRVAGGDVLAPAGGVDVLAALDAVRAAAAADDPATVHARLADLETASSQLASGRTQVGAAWDAALQGASLAERLRDVATEDVAQLVEADAFAAYSDLVRAQSVLEQAVAIAARMPPAGLASGGGR